LNLYLIERTDTIDYDQYKSAVVAATSEDDARNIHPSTKSIVPEDTDSITTDTYYILESWISLTQVGTLKVTLLGKAISKERGVVVASFIAG